MYTVIITLIAVFVATHYVWFMLRAFNGIWHELEVGNKNLFVEVEEEDETVALEAR